MIPRKIFVEQFTHIVDRLYGKCHKQEKVFVIPVVEKQVHRNNNPTALDWEKTIPGW